MQNRNGIDPALEPLDPDEVNSLFVMRHGRRYHSHGDTNAPAPYPLPCDQPEMDRLNRLHTALRMLFMGQDFIGAMHHALIHQSDGDDEVKVAVDLCTGTGKWVDDMAEAYPHARFHGLDIVHIASEAPSENVWFEVANVMQPLQWQNGSVNLVHMRDASFGITRSHFPRLLVDIARILRPGGLMVSCEWTRQLYTVDGLDPRNRAPNAVRLLHTVNERLHARGVMHDVSRIPEIVVQTQRFQSNSVSCRRYVIPLDNTHDNANLRQTYMRDHFKQAILEFGESIRGFLLDTGSSAVQAESLISGFCNDIRDAKGLVICYAVVHVRK